LGYQGNQNQSAPGGSSLRSRLHRIAIGTVRRRAFGRVAPP